MTTPITSESHGHLACLNWRTLSDQRAATVRPNTRIFRAALIMTAGCNFACPYCKTLSTSRAPTRQKAETLDLVGSLVDQGLKELRLSGGEPTTVRWLPGLVAFAHERGVRVAVSTNGYASRAVYAALVDAGVDEFSISLDSVDPDEADRLAGNRPNVLRRVTGTIETVASMGASVYVGMTCCASTAAPQQMKDTVASVASLGATDVKIMSIAQEGGVVDTSWLDESLQERFPFLAWRARNFKGGRDVRGLREDDSPKCALVLDDVTVAGDKHYPCNVYFREGGQPIGTVGDRMLADRAAWYESHDSQCDPICNSMCMDLLRMYNNRVRELQG